jgi:hypothetical protein
LRQERSQGLWDCQRRSPKHGSTTCLNGHVPLGLKPRGLSLSVRLLVLRRKRLSRAVRETGRMTSRTDPAHHKVYDRALPTSPVCLLAVRVFSGEGSRMYEQHAHPARCSLRLLSRTPASPGALGSRVCTTSFYHFLQSFGGTISCGRPNPLIVPSGFLTSFLHCHSSKAEKSLATMRDFGVASGSVFCER